MGWIESHQSLGRHRKTYALAAALNCDRHKVIGHLHELWWWALDNADVVGVLGKLPDGVVAEAAGWPLKQASMFVGAMIDAGFMERTEAGLVLHDWYDYSGRLNEKREQRRESNRVAQKHYRERQRDADVSNGAADISADSNADVSAYVSADNGVSHQPRARVDQPYLPNQPDRPPPAGPPTRPRARGFELNFADQPDEVRERLSRPSIEEGGGGGDFFPKIDERRASA